jgi:hypothetical protein
MHGKRKSKKSIRPRSSDIPNKFNTKLFVALGLLLVILLMKKYDLSIGNFNVDSIYHVVYYNEDLNALKEKVFFFRENPKQTEDTMQNTLQKEEVQDNTIDNSENLEPKTIEEIPIVNQENIDRDLSNEESNGTQ